MSNTFQRAIEYYMPESMAIQYLENSKQKVKDINSEQGQKYLCHLVNEEFGLRGYCVKVTTNSGKI